MRLQRQRRRLRRHLLLPTLLGMALSLSWSHLVLAEGSRASLFPVPEVLRPNVTFWKQIFAVFDTNGGVLHDAADVTIVYEVWYNDLPNDSQLRQSIIDEARTRYRTALINLAEGKRSHLTSDEERLWTMFQGKRHAEAFRAASSSLRFQGGMRSRFAQGLLRSWSYLPEIEAIFASMNLPRELTLLPHVESSFENRAMSKAGAAGIWQIMPATGRRFLRVTSTVDERLNVRQATIVAARLLRENYEMLGTWPLAITAYNHGPYGMKQAVAAVGSTDFGVIVQRYRGPLFGFASQNFYAEFLAAVEVAQNYQQYFDDILFREPSRLLTAAAQASPEESPLPVPMSRYDALSAPGGAGVHHLPAVTLPYGTPPAPVTTRTAAAEPFSPPTPTVAQAEALLPITESGTYATPNPIDTPPAAMVTAYLEPVEPQPLSAPTPSMFVTPALAQSSQADTPAAALPTPSYEPSPELRPVPPPVIQPRAAVPPPQLPARDRARDTRPIETVTPSIASAPAPSSPQMSSKAYRVQRGETLYALALRHNTTTTSLAALNKLPANAAVKAGQVLQVPTPPPVSSSPPVLAAEKTLPRSAILAVVSAGKPLPPVAEATQVSPPAPPVQPGLTLAAAVPGGTGQGIRLPAPPERFQVKGETIHVAAQEQLSHYATWLDVPVQRLQTLNRLSTGKTPAMGALVRLDFSKVSAAQFTQRRLQYQRSLEEDFLRRHRVGSVRTRKLKPGETLLSVSRQAPGVPLWLLQRYNTHLDANTPNPGSELRIPQVTTRAS